MAQKQSLLHNKNFKSEASKVHNSFYDYSNFIYISNRVKGRIICPLHGEFEQTPVHHINRKHGCPKCGDEAMALKQSAEAKKEFKTRAFKIHNGLYDYKKFIYINSSTKSIILCSIHGEFKQTAGTHLAGRGCPRCKAKRDNDSIYIWKAVREFYNDKPLYKIGVTSTRLNDIRIHQVADKLGWEFKIILLKSVNCEASELEQQIHLLGTNPNLTGFDGATEFRAFNKEELKEAIDIITPYIDYD